MAIGKLIRADLVVIVSLAAKPVLATPCSSFASSQDG